MSQSAYKILPPKIRPLLQKNICTERKRQTFVKIQFQWRVSLLKNLAAAVLSSHGGINSNGSKTSARISSCCSSRDNSKVMVES